MASNTNQTIKVFVRAKPLVSVDAESSNERAVLNIDESKSTISFARERKGQAEFQFTKVFGPAVTQQNVYNECADVVVQEVVEGIDCCIMAYGQTGSGKTYTMYGKGWEEGGAGTTTGSLNSINNNSNTRIKASAKSSAKNEASIVPIEDMDEDDEKLNTAPTYQEETTDPPTTDDIPQSVSDDDDKVESNTDDAELLESGDTKAQPEVVTEGSDVLSFVPTVVPPTIDSPATAAGTTATEPEITTPSEPTVSVITTPTVTTLNAVPATVDVADSMLGVIPRAISDLFRVLDEKSTNNKHFDFTINCQVMQIYNEKIYDLLQDKKRENPLQLRETSNNNNSNGGGANSGGSNTTVCVRGMSVFRIYSKEEAFQLLRKGLRNRAIRATDFNSESSRSHTILQLFVTIEEQDLQGVRIMKRSTFSLVDLAGSEKWRNSLSQSIDGGSSLGALSSSLLSSVNNNTSSSNNLVNIHNSAQQAADAQIKEMNNINTSLHVLGNCVSALIEVPARKHIPYRDSVLTRLLQDALGGNGRTILIATVHNEPLYREETYSTLQFASRASRIKVVLTNNISINAERVDLELAQKQVKNLRAKIVDLQQQLQTQTQTQSQISSGGSNKITTNSSISSVCTACESYKQGLATLKRHLQEVKDLNAYLMETLDSHYIPYDLGAVGHHTSYSSNPGSKLNTPTQSTRSVPQMSPLPSPSVSQKDLALALALATSGPTTTVSVLDRQSSNKDSIAMSPLLHKQQQQLSLEERSFTSVDDIGEGHSDYDCDDHSIVSLSASKAGGNVVSSGQPQPSRLHPPLSKPSSASMATARKVKTNKAPGSSNKLQNKLRASAAAAAVSSNPNSPSPTPSKSSQQGGNNNTSINVVKSGEHVVDDTLSQMSDISHHSVTSKTLSGSPRRIKLKTKKIKKTAATPTATAIQTSAAAHSPPSDLSIAIAKKRIKYQQEHPDKPLPELVSPSISPSKRTSPGKPSVTRSKGAAAVTAEYEAITESAAADIDADKISPSVAQVQTQNLQPPVAHMPPEHLTSTSLPSTAGSTATNNGILNYDADAEEQKVNRYIADEQKNVTAMLEQHISPAKSTTQSHTSVDYSNAVGSLRKDNEVVASVGTISAPYSVNQSVLTLEDKCAKHGLESCFLCEMFNKSNLYSAAPSVVSSAVPSPMSTVSNVSKHMPPPNQSYAAYQQQQMQQRNYQQQQLQQPQMTPVSQYNNNSHNDFSHDAFNQVYAQSLSRQVQQQTQQQQQQQPPSVRSMKPPQSVSSQHSHHQQYQQQQQQYQPHQFNSQPSPSHTLNDSISISSMISLSNHGGNGEMCKTHGVTDCLLCSMRLRREKSAATSAAASTVGILSTINGHGDHTGPPSQNGVYGKFRSSSQSNSSPQQYGENVITSPLTNPITPMGSFGQHNYDGGYQQQQQQQYYTQQQQSQGGYNQQQPMHHSQSHQQQQQQYPQYPQQQKQPFQQQQHSASSHNFTSSQISSLNSADSAEIGYGFVDHPDNASMGSNTSKPRRALHTGKFKGPSKADDGGARRTSNSSAHSQSSAGNKMRHASPGGQQQQEQEQEHNQNQYQQHIPQQLMQHQTQQNYAQQYAHQQPPAQAQLPYDMRKPSPLISGIRAIPQVGSQYQASLSSNDSVDGEEQGFPVHGTNRNPVSMGQFQHGTHQQQFQQQPYYQQQHPPHGVYNQQQQQQFSHQPTAHYNNADANAGISQQYSTNSQQHRQQQTRKPRHLQELERSSNLAPTYDQTAHSQHQQYNQQPSGLQPQKNLLDSASSHTLPSGGGSAAVGLLRSAQLNSHGQIGSSVGRGGGGGVSVSTSSHHSGGSHHSRRYESYDRSLEVDIAEQQQTYSNLTDSVNQKLLAPKVAASPLPSLTANSSTSHIQPLYTPQPGSHYNPIPADELQGQGIPHVTPSVGSKIHYVGDYDNDDDGVGDGEGGNMGGNMGVSGRRHSNIHYADKEDDDDNNDDDDDNDDDDNDDENGHQGGSSRPSSRAISSAGVAIPVTTGSGSQRVTSAATGSRKVKKVKKIKKKKRVSEKATSAGLTSSTAGGSGASSALTNAAAASLLRRKMDRVGLGR